MAVQMKSFVYASHVSPLLCYFYLLFLIIVVTVSYLLVPFLFLKSFPLCDQSSLQDDPPFLIPLVVLCGELVHPSKFGLAALTENVSDHVPPSYHHPVLDVTILQVNHLQQDNCET